jgi:hypothetical protein
MFLFPFRRGRSRLTEQARRRPYQRRLALEQLESRCLLSSAPFSAGWARPLSALVSYGFGPTGDAPAQIRHAYGFDQLTNNGAGQTIAIVDAYDDPNIGSDLNYFDNYFGLPTASFTKYTPQGKPATNSGWALEISLDVEWAHAIAPAANIVLEEAADNSYTNLLGAVDDAVKHNAAAVSMSWGGSEFSGETGNDSHFNVSGVTFVASAGDSPGTEYPAVAPGVVSVGGTTLNTTGSGNYVSESVWSSTGGGYSSQEAIPGYQGTYGSKNQQGNTVLSSQDTNNARGGPDVAYDANPSTGVAVYDTVRYGRQRGWFQVGGTSMGAPQWAALVTLADQSRTSPLSSSDTLQTLYSVAATNSTYSADFHDIGPVTGYDLQTGLGSPQANNLVPALINTTLAPAASSLSTTKSPARNNGGSHVTNPSQPSPNAVVVTVLATQAQHTPALGFPIVATTPSFTAPSTVTAASSAFAAVAPQITLTTVNSVQQSGGGDNAMISDADNNGADPLSRPAFKPMQQQAPPAAPQAAPQQEAQVMLRGAAHTAIFAEAEQSRRRAGTTQEATTEITPVRMSAAAALPALLIALGSSRVTGAEDEADLQRRRLGIV